MSYFSCQPVLWFSSLSSSPYRRFLCPPLTLPCLPPLRRPFRITKQQIRKQLTIADPSLPALIPQHLDYVKSHHNLEDTACVCLCNFHKLRVSLKWLAWGLMISSTSILALFAGPKGNQRDALKQTQTRTHHRPWDRRVPRACLRLPSCQSAWVSTSRISLHRRCALSFWQHATTLLFRKKIYTTAQRTWLKEQGFSVFDWQQHVPQSFRVLCCVKQTYGQEDEDTCAANTELCSGFLPRFPRVNRYFPAPSTQPPPPPLPPSLPSRFLYPPWCCGCRCKTSVICYSWKWPPIREPLK